MRHLDRTRSIVVTLRPRPSMRTLARLMTQRNLDTLLGPRPTPIPTPTLPSSTPPRVVRAIRLRSLRAA